MPHTVDSDIRLARPDDLPMVIRAAKSAFDDPKLKLADSRMDEALIRAKSCIVGVDERNGPVAYTTFMRKPWQAGSSLYLYEMGVHADFRGKGFGRRMLAALSALVAGAPGRAVFSGPAEAPSLPDENPNRLTFETVTRLSIEDLCMVFSFATPLDPELRYAVSSCLDYGRTVLCRDDNGKIVGCIGLFTDMAETSVHAGYALSEPMGRILARAAVEAAARFGGGDPAEKPHAPDPHAVWVTTHPDNTAMLSLLLGQSFRAVTLKVAYPLLGDEGIRFLLRHPDLRDLGNGRCAPPEGDVIGVDRKDLPGMKNFLDRGYEGVALGPGKAEMLLKKPGAATAPG